MYTYIASLIFSSQKSVSKVPAQPLKNLTFVLEGKQLDKEALRTTIETMGGKVGKKVTESTAAVVSDKGRKNIIPTDCQFITLCILSDQAKGQFR